MSASARACLRGSADRAEHRQRHGRTRDQSRGQPIRGDVQRRGRPRAGRIHARIGGIDIVHADLRRRRALRRDDRIG